MRKYSASIQSIGSFFRAQKFIHQDFQRRFCWEKQRTDELINGLQAEFSRQFLPWHNNANVAGYDQYFMGRVAVVLQGESKLVLDGWQRIVELTLLLIYVERQLTATGCIDSYLASLISSQQNGVRTTHLECTQCGPAVQAILNGTQLVSPKADSVVSNINKCYSHYTNSNLFKTLEKSSAQFLFFLREKLVLEELIVDAVSDANNMFSIFCTLNSNEKILSPKQVNYAALSAVGSDPINTAHSQELTE